MSPPDPEIDVALIAPFCDDNNSPWFSPGRQRKLAQVTEILQRSDLRWQGLSTCPIDSSSGSTQPDDQGEALPRLRLCSSDRWPIRLLQTILRTLAIGRQMARQSKKPVLWLYNTRVSEALVALVLMRLHKPGSRRPQLLLQLEDLPAARQANAGVRGFLDLHCTTLLAKRTGTALCVSEPVAQAFQSISGFPRSRIQILPPLLDAGAMQAMTQRDEPFQGKSITIVYAGGYDPEKGVADLLIAFQSLPPERYQLLLFGPIPAPLHTQLARQPGIELRGLVPLPKLFTAYSQADVVVNPHRPITNSSHVFPFKLIEILASGALPLTTPMPGIEAYGLPNDCLFQGPSQLARRLQQAPQLWQRHRTSLQQLAQQVRHQHSFEKAQHTIRQAIESLP